MSWVWTYESENTFEASEKCHIGSWMDGMALRGNTWTKEG